MPAATPIDGGGPPGQVIVTLGAYTGDPGSHIATVDCGYYGGTTRTLTILAGGTTSTGGRGPMTDTTGIFSRLDRLDSKVDRAEDRLGRVETDVATIKERLSHVPTKVEMWAAMVAVAAILGGGLIWYAENRGPTLIEHTVEQVMEAKKDSKP